MQSQLIKSTYHTLTENNPLNILNTRKDSVIDLAPANSELSQVERKLAERALVKLYYLMEQVDKIAGQYDFVLIDTPGSLDLTNTQFLWLLITCLFQFLLNLTPFTATEQTVDFIRDYQNQNKFPIRSKLAGVFVSRTNDKTITHRYTYDLLQESLAPEYNTHIFKSMIGNRTDLSTAAIDVLTITEFDSKSKAAREYTDFTNELLSYIEDNYGKKETKG